jgi:hypothetical protein
MKLPHHIHHVALVLGALSLAGCAPVFNIDNQARRAAQSVLVSGASTNLSAGDRAAVPAVAERAARLDPEEIGRRPGAERVGIEALPFLTRTEAGRDFLSLPAPRALARGEPAEVCPATGVSAAGAPDREAAVRSALGACLDRLDALGAPEGCGCGVLVVDDVATAERTSLAYSTGTAARLHAPELGLDKLLVAEDTGPGETLIRDVSGPIASLRHLPGGRAELDFGDPGLGTFSGHAEPVGFRRGRLAERIYLEDGEGRRISLLIGFGPDELARFAGGWLVWRNGGGGTG